MHSTRLIGQLIFFINGTLIFHFIFQIKPGFSQVGVWIASVCFGLIAAYALKVGTQGKESN